MNTLFLIFVRPLQVLMDSILNYAYTISDNYVIAIIVLSIIVNIILLPLYHFAEKLQNKERAVQSKLRPKIEEINSVFQGAERFMMMHTLYRQAGYHPIYAIRTSLGFLIQVPFFLAAYLLLLNYEPFNGVSVLWFSDLSQADKLIFGVNIMPIIMTLVNLASGFIYTKNLTKNEKIQIWVISILFLVLLYQSPVALVLYWTLNNVFSLFKNIAYHRFSKPTDLSFQPEKSLFSKTLQSWKELWQNESRFNIRHNIKDIATSGTLKIFLFLFLAERVLYYNLFSQSGTSHTNIINIGVGAAFLLLIALSIKKLPFNIRHFLRYLGHQTVALKKSINRQWIYPLFWSTLFLIFLIKVKAYSDLSKILNKTHADVSTAIAVSNLILIFLCCLGLLSFFRRFDKKQLQHIISAIIISALNLISITLIISWIINSYIITEPIYIKEALTGILCIQLIVIHYDKILNALKKLALFRNHLVVNYLTIYPIFKIILIILLLLNLFSFLSLENSHPSRQFYLLESLFIAFFFFFVFLNGVRKYELKPNIWLFLSSASLLFYMILVSGPLMLYASSLESIHISKLHLVLPHLTDFARLLIFSSFVYILVSDNFKKLIIFSIVFSIIVGYLYTFVLIKNFGQLDAFKFRNPALLEVEPWIIIFELITGVILAFGVWRFLPRFQKTLIPLLIIMLASVAVYSSFKLITNKAINAVTYSDTSEGLQKINTYSKHQNIIIFMLDGFSGIEINRVMAQNPDFLKNYTGFTWYPNTLTTGTSTWASIAALSAGHQFTVSAINQKKNTTFHNEIDAAYSLFPDNFLNHGFEISYINPQYGNCDRMKEIVCFPSFEQLIKINTESMAYKTINMISLFGASPFSLKKMIYDDGNWLIKTQKNITKNTNKVKHWEFLKHMGDKAIVSDRPIKTLKYYQFVIPHTPAIVNSRCEYSNYGDYRSEAKCALFYISKLISRLKREGIYDATKLILVSDHGLWHISGTGTFSKEMQKNMRQLENESKENRLSMPIIQPLMFVKDFDSKHKSVKIDNTFLSNADVAAMVCSAIKGCPGVIPDPTKYKIKNRKLRIHNAFLDGEKDKDAVFSIPNQYEVTNTIFEWKNWKKLK